MVVAYEETPEDRTLTSEFRLYNGRRIDTRWSGGWLTPDGEYFPVDCKNGITHETLANEHGSHICGSGSIMTRPPIMRLFDIEGWMRITYLEGSSFCVELKGTFVDNLMVSGMSGEEIYAYNRRRQHAILQFVRDYSRFDCYFINDTKHDSFREFQQAIRRNKVDPVRAERDHG